MKYTTQAFIEKAKQIHGDKYNYDKVNCENKNKGKIKIICPIHGEFEQRLHNHLQGKGCPKCALDKKSQELANNKKTNNRIQRVSCTQDFIKKSQTIHGNKYDYSKVNYVNDKTKVCIICPIHGEFFMLPSNHIHKTHPQHCPKCVHPSQRKSTIDFINEAQAIHGDKYDYSKVEYVNNKTKICIICKEHGEFYQRPSDHLNGCGCKQCTLKVPQNHHQRLTNIEFIEKARKIHGNIYNYNKVNYQGVNEKIVIICPIHGEFMQTPNNHLKGQGCPQCARKNVKRKSKFTQENIIQRFYDKHGNKYDYSKVKFIDRDEKVIIICPIHGEFEQTPHNHYNGQGCPQCAKIKRGLKQSNTKEIFIKKAISVHGDKYDYSKVEYVNNKTKILIGCPKHGYFLQRPLDHIKGKGCKKCKQSHLEKKVELLMIKNNIEYQTEYHNKKWLETLTLDFYLPTYNIAIECQGIQHFQPIKQFGGEETFKKTIERDKRKKELCEQNNIQLLYFSDKKYSDNIITSQKELINKILKS